MSQTDIDAFILSVSSVGYNSLTSEGVVTAVGIRGISVNRRRSGDGWSALHYAVHWERRDLVVALLAAGADPNMKDGSGTTSVWYAAYSNADILRLLIHGGGSVNEADNFRKTPLIELVRWNRHDAAARLQVLLACPELDLDAACEEITAERWAVKMRHLKLAVAIAKERAGRKRWGNLRSAWIGATVIGLLAAFQLAAAIEKERP
jgi:ankyrin repeat protein